jgi:cytochrome P450
MLKVRNEIDAVMRDSRLPSREQLRRMPYLSCVIKESACVLFQSPNSPITFTPGLRVYPPVPLNNRTAKVTTILPTGGGPDGVDPILVRKGELVVFSQYVNSRVRSIYGQAADEFVPERWQSDELASIGWAYFPFSGGPRRCLGEDFAVMEISYTIVRLLRATQSIELPEDEDRRSIGSEKQRLTLVLAPADGSRVTLTMK